jgi:hypothetical protein
MVTQARPADIIEDHGTSRLGIDTLPQVVTRGLLLDVAYQVALTGCDTWSFGPYPVISHAKLRGATGAWVAPLAIV